MEGEGRMGESHRKVQVSSYQIRDEFLKALIKRDICNRVCWAGLLCWTFAAYTKTESVCCTPETNIICQLYLNNKNKTKLCVLLLYLQPSLVSLCSSLVFVSSGYHNKLQIQGLQTTKMYSLTVLEARSPKPEVSRATLPLKAQEWGVGGVGRITSPPLLSSSGSQQGPVLSANCITPTFASVFMQASLHLVHLAVLSL